MEKSGFRKNFESFLTWFFSWSESFLIRTSKGRATASRLVLVKGGQPSEIALQGVSLQSKIVNRGVGADFEKYFRLTMNRVACNVECGQ